MLLHSFDDLHKIPTQKFNSVDMKFEKTDCKTENLKLRVDLVLFCCHWCLVKPQS